MPIVCYACRGYEKWLGESSVQRERGIVSSHFPPNRRATEGEIEWHSLRELVILFGEQHPSVAGLAAHTFFLCAREAGAACERFFYP